jgi:hypothetical protein
VNDEVLDTFAVIGSPEDAVTQVLDRYGDIATRISLTLPDDAQAKRWTPLFEQLRAA